MKRLTNTLLALLATLSINANAQDTNTSVQLKDFNLQDKKVSLFIPRDLKESFITSDDSMYISYATDNGAYSVIFKFSKLKDSNIEYLMQSENFKDTALIPYYDKENYLYGECDILDYKKQDKRIYLHTTSFLRKAMDNYMPEAYFALMDYYEINDNILATITCRASGSYAQKANVDTIFNTYKSMCQSIIGQNKENIRNISHVLK